MKLEQEARKKKEDAFERRIRNVREQEVTDWEKKVLRILVETDVMIGDPQMTEMRRRDVIRYRR